MKLSLIATLAGNDYCENLHGKSFVWATDRVLELSISDSTFVNDLLDTVLLLNE